MAFLLFLFLLLKSTATNSETAPIHFRGLYMGWLGHFNAGDDLLFYEIEKMITSTSLHLNPPIAVSLHPLYVANPCEQLLVDMSQYDFIILGGGSILTQDEYSCQLNQAVSLNLPIFVGGSGWDPRTPIKNGDILDLDYDIWRDRFARAGEFGWGGVRGPMTFLPLHHYFPNTKLDIIGDAGMLVNPDDYQIRPTFIPDELSQYIAVGYGVNVGNSIYHQNKDGALDQAIFSFVLHEIIQNGRNIVLYAMDGPSLQVIDNLFKSVSMTLAQKKDDDGHLSIHEGHIHIIPHVLDAGSSCRLFYHATATVNYKLHGSIMSGGVGTPFVAMAYHFKHWDFAADYEQNLDELTINTDAVEKNWKILSRALATILEPTRYSELKELFQIGRQRTRLRWKKAVTEFIAELVNRNQ
jgi:hypothetical protein